MSDLQHPILFLLAHPIVIVVLAAAYVFVVIVGSMPPLPPGAGYFTQWMYAIVQAFAGNFKKLAHLAAETPQARVIESTLTSKTTETTPLP